MTILISVLFIDVCRVSKINFFCRATYLDFWPAVSYDNHCKNLRMANCCTVSEMYPYPPNFVLTRQTLSINGKFTRFEF